MAQATPTEIAAGIIEHVGGAGSPRVPSVDTSYKPGEDFYMYVNSKWQNSVKMPDYEDDFGVSEEIELELQNVLLRGVKHYMRVKPRDGISKLAQSFLDDSVQDSSITDLIKELSALDCINSFETFSAAVGHLNQIQCRAPFSFVVNSDYYNSKECCLYIYECSLCLPSKKDYAPSPSNKILPAYRHFLSQLGAFFRIEDLESVASFESHLLPFLSEASDLRDVSYVYNPMTIAQLEEKYPAISWRIALGAWGLKGKAVEDTKYIITNTKYFVHLNKLLKEKEFGKLIHAMKANIIVNYLKYLPPPLDDIHYKFYERFLRGVHEKTPQDVLTLRVLMKFAQQDLGRMFVDMEVGPNIKKTATKYIQMLKAATCARIKKLKWMEESTQANALKKAESMRFQVAFPDTWESETRGIHIDSSRPLQNLIHLSIADTLRMIDELKRGTCSKRPNKWRDGAFEVNAYYYPEGNMMVVPAGILRPPFFDPDRSQGWNLGSIGVAISHEITHGFDDDGRLFDDEGNYKDWWTVSDERSYRAMSKAVVQLFEGQKYMGGKVDGKLTLNENLADIGGMAIALEALNSVLPGDSEARKAAYRDFFIGFAVSWRQKDRPKKARQALLLDVHAPPYYRVNLIVRQFEEFYQAFDIRPTDKGYIPPKDRIVFW